MKFEHICFFLLVTIFFSCKKSTVEIPVLLNTEQKLLGTWKYTKMIVHSYHSNSNFYDTTIAFPTDFMEFKKNGTAVTEFNIIQANFTFILLSDNRMKLSGNIFDILTLNMNNLILSNKDTSSFSPLQFRDTQLFVFR